jgi:hypothetical protein
VILDGEAQINRTEFGLTFNPLGVASMDNTIIVHAVFGRRRRSSPGPTLETPLDPQSQWKEPSCLP